MAQGRSRHSVKRGSRLIATQPEEASNARSSAFSPDRKPMTKSIALSDKLPHAAINVVQASRKQPGCEKWPWTDISAARAQACGNETDHGTRRVRTYRLPDIALRRPCRSSIDQVAYDELAVERVETPVHAKGMRSTAHRADAGRLSRIAVGCARSAAESESHTSLGCAQRSGAAVCSLLPRLPHDSRSAETLRPSRMQACVENRARCHAPPAAAANYLFPRRGMLPVSTVLWRSSGPISMSRAKRAGGRHSAHSAQPESAARLWRAPRIPLTGCSLWKTFESRSKDLRRSSGRHIVAVQPCSWLALLDNGPFANSSTIVWPYHRDEVLPARQPGHAAHLARRRPALASGRE